MKGRKSIIKKIGIVFGCIVGIFLIINLVWFLGAKVRYMELVKDMNKVYRTEAEKEQGLNDNTYQKEKDGYVYNVRVVDYLGYSGFATVCKEEGLVYTVDENNNILSSNGICCTLMVWPKMFVGYKFGLDISGIDSTGEELWIQIRIDENGNLVQDEEMDPDYAAELREMLEENREEVNKLLSLADEQWDIR